MKIIYIQTMCRIDDVVKAKLYLILPNGDYIAKIKNKYKVINESQIASKEQYEISKKISKLERKIESLSGLKRQYTQKSQTITK